MNSSDKIIRMPDHNYTPEEGGYGVALYNALKQNGDSIAQIDAITGDQDTCASLLQRCIRTAIRMRVKGIQKDDILTISCYNHLDSCTPFIASAFLGAKTANIDPTVTKDEIIYLLKQVHPKMIFILPESVDVIQRAISEGGLKTEIVVFGDTFNHTSFSEFLQETEEEQSFEPLKITNFQDIAVIIFSSGSTGYPKGICLSYYTMGYYSFHLKNFSLHHAVLLTFSSIYWITQIAMIILGTLGNCPRVILPQFDIERVWQLIAKYKVNFTLMAPAHAIAMSRVTLSPTMDLSSLKVVYIGGSKVSEEHIMNLQKQIPEALVTQGYALTESGGNGLTFAPGIEYDKAKLYKSIGKPCVGVHYKVVDTETEEILGPNQQGELRLKTDLAMVGYYGVDSSDMWDSNGYLKTGDMVYYDEELYFYYVERIKEMIKYQGHQVFPAMLENVLMTHPQIKNAAVMGVPHPEHGDLPTAFVVLETSDDVITPQEIIEYVDKRVDHKSKLRGGVNIVQDIPTASSGKIRRKVFKDMLKTAKL